MLVKLLVAVYCVWRVFAWVLFDAPVSLGCNIEVFAHMDLTCAQTQLITVPYSHWTKPLKNTPFDVYRRNACAQFSCDLLRKNNINMTDYLKIDPLMTSQYAVNCDIIVIGFAAIIVPWILCLFARMLFTPSDKLGKFFDEARVFAMVAYALIFSAIPAWQHSTDLKAVLMFNSFDIIFPLLFGILMNRVKSSNIPVQDKKGSKKKTQ
jgi:hypothetical protein